jgi:hypothetical protein
MAETDEDVRKEFFMALTIVWRNPEPLIRTKQSVEKFRSDESCAVYVVTEADRTQEFTLICGQAA